MLMFVIFEKGKSFIVRIFRVKNGNLSSIEINTFYYKISFPYFFKRDRGDAKRLI